MNLQLRFTPAKWSEDDAGKTLFRLTLNGESHAISSSDKREYGLLSCWMTLEGDVLP
ncbi:hypothetical protein AA0522_0991 [Gluconacetobacter liquefaciens NRIC 0522]|nr:hypothetical protein AA0522_0991 [Gluconacetobacter liquefaciens NRIC 0522]